MFTKIYWINHQTIDKNCLGTMERPRGNDWLDDEIRGLKYQEVDCLISLLEYAEQEELDLLEEENICTKYEIKYLNFPIQDVSIPSNEVAFRQVVNQLVEYLNQGKRIVIHCRMGIGRSSVLAAEVLIKMGCPAKGIFEHISQCRGLEVPDTTEQKAWIMSLAKWLKLA